MPYAIVMAVETAGSGPYTPQIVEAAAVVLGPALNEIEHFRVVANPGDDVLGRDSETLLRRGVLVEEIRAGEAPDEAARRYREFLGRHSTGMVVHRSRRGLDALSRPPWGLPKPRTGEDVVQAAMELMSDSGALDADSRGVFKRPTLVEIARFLDLSLEPGRGSLGCARTVAALYAAIVARRNSPELAIMSEAKWVMEDGL